MNLGDSRLHQPGDQLAGVGWVEGLLAGDGQLRHVRHHECPSQAGRSPRQCRRSKSDRLRDAVQPHLEDILFGRGARDYSIVSPTAPEYTPAWSIYTTDLAKAKALMKAAGSPTINVPLYYLSSDVDQTNTAILIQASLKSIGITTTLTPETQAGLFDVVDARSTPASGAQIGPPGLELFNWSAWTDDPKIVIGYWATTGGINNYSLWSNPDGRRPQQQVLVAQPPLPRGRRPTRRRRTIIAAAAPVIPIVYTGTVAVMTAGITGVSFSPGGSGRYWLMHPVGTTNPLDSMVG